MNTRATYTLPGGRTIAIIHGDIIEANVDAIVNAANEHLQHGGGVAGAISRRGGDSIQAQSNQWVREHGKVPTGSAAITGAGRLPAKYVIHAVGPVWGSGDEERKLAAAVTSALSLADEHEVTSIAIPAISSGIYGMPKDVSARVLIRAIVEYLHHHPKSTLRTVQFCNIDEVTVKVFAAQAPLVLGEESQ
ncbi:MAG: macro domain-containing protein [Caldilineaceae bacterium]